jgi:hypothetical protein
MRIDAALLVGPIAVGYLLSAKRTTAPVVGIVTAVTLIGIYAVFQWHWFHQFLPTTARLKANYLVPPSYQAKYFLRAIASGAAAGFVPVILVTHYRRLMRSSMLVKAAVGGVALEYVYAYMVSDVFSGARMYLAPLAVSLVAVASLDDAESTDKGRIGAYPPSSRALYVLSRKSR